MDTQGPRKVSDTVLTRERVLLLLNDNHGTKHFCDEVYPETEKVILVTGNLTTWPASGQDYCRVVCNTNGYATRSKLYTEVIS